MRDIKTKEQVLEDLLKANGFYNEQEINERMERQKTMWLENELRANVLYNIGLNNNCFTEIEVDLKIAFEIFQDKFNNDWGDFINFYKKLGNEHKEKFLDLSRFYYNWCKEPSVCKNLDRSYKLIIITSIIETLMSKYKFKEFKQWFDKECDIKIKILARKYFYCYGLKRQMEFLWSEYKKIHGATKKVRNFFELYINKDDRSYIINNFKLYNKTNKQFEKDELNKIINLLYYMRSKFVHESQIVQLPRRAGDYLGHIIGNTGVQIRIDINQFLRIFENGFINYFKTTHANTR